MHNIVILFILEYAVINYTFSLNDPNNIKASLLIYIGTFISEYKFDIMDRIIINSFMIIVSSFLSL